MSNTWSLLVLMSLKCCDVKQASQNSRCVFLMNTLKIIWSFLNYSLLLLIWTVLKKLKRRTTFQHLHLSSHINTQKLKHGPTNRIHIKVLFVYIRGCVLRKAMPRWVKENESVSLHFPASRFNVPIVSFCSRRFHSRERER
jgi:hypothetical protein